LYSQWGWELAVSKTQFRVSDFGNPGFSFNQTNQYFNLGGPGLTSYIPDSSWSLALNFYPSLTRDPEGKVYTTLGFGPSIDYKGWYLIIPPYFINGASYTSFGISYHFN
jgi:hypothetical protein